MTGFSGVGRPAGIVPRTVGFWAKLVDTPEWRERALPAFIALAPFCRHDALRRLYQETLWATVWVAVFHRLSSEMTRQEEVVRRVRKRVEWSRKSFYGVVSWRDELDFDRL